MHIIQVTQLFNIMGGAGGYMLAANNYVAILVGAEERTSMFGVLQGMAMLGASVGFTGGFLVLSVCWMMVGEGGKGRQEKGVEAGGRERGEMKGREER